MLLENVFVLKSSVLTQPIVSAPAAWNINTNANPSAEYQVRGIHMRECAHTHIHTHSLWARDMY